MRLSELTSKSSPKHSFDLRKTADRRKRHAKLQGRQIYHHPRDEWRQRPLPKRGGDAKRTRQPRHRLWSFRKIFIVTNMRIWENRVVVYFGGKKLPLNRIRYLVFLIEVFNKLPGYIDFRTISGIYFFYFRTTSGQLPAMIFFTSGIWIYISGLNIWLLLGTV